MRAALLEFLCQCFFRLWNRQGLDAHGGQELQRECKAERAFVDLVDERLHHNGFVRGFQATGKLLVRESALPKVFDDGFGLRLVKRVRLHRVQAYMLLGVPGW